MIAVSSFGLGFSLLLQSVAVAATLAVGSEITKRDDYNAITYQGGEVAPYCTSSESTSSPSRRRSTHASRTEAAVSMINVTTVTGSDPPAGVLNFADYCTDPGSTPATSVASSFTVENDCNYDKTYVVTITYGNGTVFSNSTFTLNVGGALWQENFYLPSRPSTAVITSGTDVITFEYPEYEAVETSLWTEVWWCDGD